MGSSASNFNTISYMQSVFENQRREQEIRRKYGYTNQDYVTIHTLPKGQRTKKYASFCYKPLSARAKRLQNNIAAIQGKIKKTENDPSLSQQEKQKLLGHLRCTLKYESCRLSTEVQAMPRVGVIVLEEGEE